MSRRFTSEEKGKSLAATTLPGIRRRIRAPDLDNSALVQANALTLIGRLTNPQEQSVRDIISFLPKKWDIEGPVAGSDLGHFRFQFRLSSEKDLQSVLSNRPYHYDNWMIILERWEPIISDAFPSQIPFWITLQGLPLHFWHHKMIYEIALDMGALETYSITSTSARMKVLVNGLNPLIKETMIDFKSGEESLLTLEYEGLKNHCSLCSRLSHMEPDCPFRNELNAVVPPPSFAPPPNAPTDRGTARLPPQPYHSEICREDMITGSKRAATEVEPPRQFPATTSFEQRLDRHGKPFGDRISLPPSTARPLKNKITPGSVVAKEHDRRKDMVSQQREPRHDIVEQRLNSKEDRRGDTSRRRRLSPHGPNPPAGLFNQRYRGTADTGKRHREDQARRDLRNNPSPHHNISPPYTTNRKRRTATSPRFYRENRERQALPLNQLESDHAIEAPNGEECEVNSRPASGRETLVLPRPPLERNLNVLDFTPPPPPVPTKEQVMDQLREDAHRYVSHHDPVESEARIQRVLDSNARGEMEDTAERIIASARALSLASSPAQQIVSFHPEPGYDQNAGQEISFASLNEVLEVTQQSDSQRAPRAARPPKSKRNASTSRALLGSNLRKHNLAMSHRSPTVRPPAIDNPSQTPARSSGMGTNQTRRESTARENSPPSHRTPTQRTSRRAQQGTQPENDAVQQVDFHHRARDLP